MLARSQSVGQSARVLLAEKGLAEGADWSGESRQQGQLLFVVAGLGGWIVARWWVSC